jgi:hypothetical protein
LGLMPSRMIRVMLALAVAFVFTGRMEAAAAHCAQLMHAQATTEAPANMEPGSPCHGMGEMTKPASPAHHKPAAEHCECLAVLTSCAAMTSLLAEAVHIEPYHWTRPQAVAFSSTEPRPSLRPPRA